HNIGLCLIKFLLHNQETTSNIKHLHMFRVNHLHIALLDRKNIKQGLYCIMLNLHEQREKWEGVAR
ncbi:hypothetical protein ACJX0J_026826, partial [Zea mays]